MVKLEGVELLTTPFELAEYNNANYGQGIEGAKRS